MKIIEKELTWDILKKYNEIKLIKDIKDKKIIEVYDNDELVTVAFITLPSKRIINKIIDQNLHYLIEDNDSQEIERISETMNNKIYLDFIKSYNRSLGGAKKILDYLKHEYKNIWLYAVIEAEEFWGKQGFREMIEHVYVS
ncbi:MULTISPECIES: hypothetical protein [unclassified Clostridium]|nr:MULTISPECIES: hypothetical protein [unclassified Clostridium]